jgi:hypothetical protein
MNRLSPFSISRRRFLRHTATAAGGLTVGLALPRVSLRAAVGTGPREGVRVGCIAVGNQGKPLMLQNYQNVVAVCEVDRLRLEAAQKESRIGPGASARRIRTIGGCSRIGR